MLEITHLLKIATGQAGAGAWRSRAPLRYEPVNAAPPVVVWNVCRHCNLHCPHCYSSASTRPSQYDLSTPEALRLLDDMAGVGVRVVIFSGGEPLLRSDVFDLMARARDLGLEPMLSSNGVLLDGASVRKLANAGTRYVGVSLDGLADQNDVYRGLEGAFASAVQGLRHAMDAGLRVGIRLTLTRESEGQLEPLLAFADRLGVHRFYVSHLLPSGRGLGLADRDLAPAESRDLLEKLFTLAERLYETNSSLSLITGGNDSDGPFFLQWLEARHGPETSSRARTALLDRGGNSAGERILAIDANGRVHPDQFWQSAELGSVRAQPMAEILTHPLRAQLRDREKHLRGRCAECVFKSICRGSHRERAQVRFGDMWAPDPACVMTDAEIGAVASQAVGGTA